MPEEIKKTGPDHYRYIDTIGSDGLEVHCITYTVIGETAQCWYIADKYTVNMIIDKQRGLSKEWGFRVSATDSRGPVLTILKRRTG
ncbi:hypothetical protein SAMN03159489_02736 [Pseudomonas sp. NFPP07]|jgi:hypothetical protein|uniref:hypothetical protein n=1 Tax=Pseudomonas TaxID=286 RepID=UPI0008E5297F|nr:MULTISPECIES: hypothetical protein [Pseudomonas]AZD15019.1 hypothetical protein C4K25_2090 [Pseudomonas chlororaphis]MCP1479721.1 hypothetical protein [Pseudomonas chlororaphis]MCP1593927.1 hypothetical protein [Pseudomonas chlororaphis]WDH49460.1 hypothetical protein PUP66_11470 [Pseudomonas chlororaphis]WDH61310.1 hypothetical protein PUP56_11470 [Pseudomonas chlororaphis]